MHQRKGPGKCAGPFLVLGKTGADLLLQITGKTSQPAISRGSHVTMPGKMNRIAMARICSATNGMMPL